MVTPLPNQYPYQLFLIIWLRGFRPVQNSNGDSASPWYVPVCVSSCQELCPFSCQAIITDVCLHDFDQVLFWEFAVVCSQGHQLLCHCVILCLFLPYDTSSIAQSQFCGNYSVIPLRLRVQLGCVPQPCFFLKKNKEIAYVINYQMMSVPFYVIITQGNTNSTISICSPSQCAMQVRIQLPKNYTLSFPLSQFQTVRK